MLWSRLASPHAQPLIGSLMTAMTQGTAHGYERPRAPVLMFVTKTCGMRSGRCTAQANTKSMVCRQAATEFSAGRVRACVWIYMCVCVCVCLGAHSHVCGCARTWHKKGVKACGHSINPLYILTSTSSIPPVLISSALGPAHTSLHTSYA